MTITMDVVVESGTVYDGNGGTPYVADVGIDGDRVVALGDLSGAHARERVKAGGYAVAPGFIDTHAHSDVTQFLPFDEDGALMSASVRQGVTTEVVGNCGFSAFPHHPGHQDDLVNLTVGLLGEAGRRWASCEAYLEAVGAAPRLNNVASLVGHGSLRAGLVGLSVAELDGAALSRVEKALRQALDEGAAGLSAGLVYAPGAYASTDELVRLARICAADGRPYSTHVRGETDMVRVAIEEALEIGRRSGAPVHISHHKVAGVANWGRTQETLEIIDAARSAGVDVTLDMYPYTSGSTMLHSLLPPWVQLGGLPHLVERLGRRDIRGRLHEEFRRGLPGWENLARAAGWDKVTVTTAESSEWAIGLTLAEIGAAQGKEPTEVAFDLIVCEEGRVTVALEMLSSDDVRAVLSHEACMVGSDGIPLPGRPHPRWAGSFARFLGTYCRDLRLTDLATAVRKVSSLPADRFGLVGRGRLTPGSYADLVIFDPATVQDGATFQDPLLPPTGIRSVYVNGQRVVEDNAVTDSRPGRSVSI